MNHIFFELNRNCNQRCVFCYNSHSYQSLEEGNYSQIKRVFKKTAELLYPNSVISITGGEPTISPFLSDFIRLVGENDKCFKAHLISNGMRLSDKEYLDGLIEAGLEAVQISIQSHNEKLHDSITQIEGGWKRTMKGVENCLRRKNLIRMNTNTTINSLNCESIVDTLNFLSDFGVETISMNLINPDKDGSNKEYLVNYRKAAEYYRSLYLVSNLKNINFKFLSPIPDSLLNSGVSLRKNTCSAGTGALLVNYKGEVFPCPTFTEPMGNVFKPENLKFNLKKIDDFKGIKIKDPRTICQKYVGCLYE